MSSNSSGGFLRGCLIVLVVFIVIGFLGFLALTTVTGIIIGMIGETATAASTDYTAEFISGNQEAENRIAVIDVKGTITSDSESFGSLVANSKQIVKLIR
ncbi:MAG: hypothetical protein IKP09_01350, partial [Lentisphaeria bacterium]|nr:hypothetical protein [Lentisphaeria bacterium]